MRRTFSQRGIGPRLAIAVAALLVATAPIGRAQQPEPPKFQPAEFRRQGFSVVLLVGDMQGGESLDGVPAAARKALADTKDFLPYKNYRLLDSQWTLCCSGSTSAITRLRGVDEQEYQLELRASPAPAVFDATRPPASKNDPNALSIRFFLREPAGTAAPSKELAGKGGSTPVAVEARIAQINQELFTLEREKVDLENQVTKGRSEVEIGMKDPNEVRRASDQLNLVVRRIATLKSELSSSNQTKLAAGGKAVIDTSFRMEIGETVVVGTSGLKGGNRALIALLTAVGKRPTK